jgi:hypothetical protein
MDEQIKRLEGVCGKQELAEVKILQHALYTTIGAYRDDPSAVNKRNWDAANSGLAATLARLTEKYFPAAAADAEPLPNLLAAAAFLQADGWKVGKSKLYKDAKAGLVRVNADGTVNEAEAIAYAHKYLKKKLADGGSAAIEDLLREEKEAQVALLKTREEKLRFEKDLAQGLYLLRDDVILETAIKIGVLEAGLKNVVRSRSEEWLHQVGADIARADLLRELVYREIDDLLDAFGNMDQIGVRIKKKTAKDAMGIEV